MSPDNYDSQPWYRQLNRYQWLVLIVAIFGWMFDTMAQQLFSLARLPAVRDLLGGKADPGTVSAQAVWATAIFMIGWALGGVIFGILGDRLGRAKTMGLTILLYTLFTGMSLFARSIWDFNVYRFFCGLGVGGQFAVGVTLVAEVVPERARPYALGMVQAFSTVGNMIAAGIGIGLGQMQLSGAIGGAWRYMFLAGMAPAPLAFIVFRKLKEPEQWLQAKARKEAMGSFRDLLSEARWRRNAIAGMLMASAGVVGLWGIGYFSYDLLRPVLEKIFRAQGYDAATVAGKTTTWIGITSLLQNTGGFLGVHAFTWLTGRTNRRTAFTVAFLAAMGMSSYTFLHVRTIGGIFWMIPLMGFSQMMIFGGYAIYLPELFPTRLRSTGTSFCYNVGRLVAALGVLSQGLLTSRVFHGPEAMRYAGASMCAVFLVGLAALPFAPETKGLPLPE